MHPSAVDYTLALQNPGTAFNDARLRTATFTQGAFGPYGIAGGNAVVFHAKIEGKEYALRCYTRQDVSTPERYAAINSFVASKGLSKYVGNVTWYSQALWVRGTRWPVLQMEWIAGQQLNEYVGYLADVGNGAAIGALGARWRELIALLQLSQFGHGNLEHGSVMVDRQGQLRLVDYDGVWIPQLAGEPPGTEHGHPGYQHPGSRLRRWGRWVDTFPALVIYVALVALAKEPGLWGALNNGDNMLFDKQDFLPPFTTEVWRRLSALGDPQVDELARRLRECCAPDWAASKSLEDTLGPFPQSAAAATRERTIPPAPRPAPGRIFISYRRDDTAYPCGWLYDKLVQYFGQDQVFKDIDSIELGDDFGEVITGAVQSCNVLLALIGSRWLTITNEDGLRRLDDPNDFVRLEIEAAITRNIRVIPVLVEGVRMPRTDQVPPSLAKLTRRQSLELSSRHFDFDIQRLLKVIDKTLTGEQAAPG